MVIDFFESRFVTQKMKNIISLIFALFLFSCKKDAPVAEQNTIYQPIIGQWELVNVTGGFSGGGRPVDSKGEEISFNQDYSFSATVVDLPSEGFYRVTFDQTNKGYQINLNGVDFNSYYIDIENDSLNLAWTGNDGYNYLFARK
jgi:hypothetical protein